MLMKCLVLCLCLHLYIQVQAQQFKKNEVTIGYGAGYFFDSTDFKMTSPDAICGPCNVNVAYTRRVTKHLSFSVLFARHRFEHNRNSGADALKPNTIIERSTEAWGISAGYAVVSDKMPVRIKVGFARSSGSKLNFYGYHWITHEPIWEGVGYKKRSLSIGASIGHPIVWRFFGELNGEYFRVNTDLDPSQFYLSYRIGFKF